MPPITPRSANTPALDGLRGLAVLIVLLSHLANAGLPVLPGFSFSGTGKSGVYLFFVLSAFLLTRILLAKPWAQWRQGHTWADYTLRRVIRIWPAYLVVLLLSTAITLAGLAPWWPYPIDAASLLRHLLLLEGVSVLWSVPVEFHYYLWLPLVALLLGLAAQRAGPWAALALAVLLSAAAWALWPPAESRVNDVRLGPYLAQFFAGALAAVLSLRWQAKGRPPRGLLLAGVLAVLALIASMPAVPALLGLMPFTPDLNHRWFAFFGLAWASLLLVVVHGPAGWRRPFEWKPLRVLGWLSFSVYLWHMPVLAAVTGPLALSGLPALAVFAFGTALVSWASWRAFERPFQSVRWRRA